MPDQVPSDGDRRRVDFRQCLLDSILTDVAQASVPSRLNGIGAVGLGHCNDRNRLAVPTTPRRQVDFSAHVP
jgi:hypothetical protein